MFLFHLIPRYGNWGGPGYSAGRFSDNPLETNWSLESQDDMDQCFKYHDYQYQNSKSFQYSRYSADHDLVHDLIEIGCPWNWKKKPKYYIYSFLYRYFALVAFYIKIIGYRGYFNIEEIKYS